MEQKEGFLKASQNYEVSVLKAWVVTMSPDLAVALKILSFERSQ